MVKEDININDLIVSEGCFDLQFRQDIKHNRLNSPTYYRWKVQFVITQSGQNKNILEKVKNILNCGRIHLIKDRMHYSVQNLDEIKNTLIPYLRSHPMSKMKKECFDLWVKAVDIIYKNKNKVFSSWEKNEFQKLIDIQRSSIRFKNKSKDLKWIEVAKDLIKTLRIT